MAIVAALAVLIAVVCIVFKDELRAVYYAARYSSEEIEEMQKENDKLIQDTVFEITDQYFIALDTAQTESLEKGEITRDDAINIILGREQRPELPTEYDKNKNAVLEKIAEVYVLKSTFTYRLHSLFNEAKAKYIALPAEDRKSVAVLKDLLGKYGTLAGNMEKECNESMDVICAEISKLLPLINGDPKIVNTIQYAYAQEKNLTKAYYMDKYAGRLAELS